MGRRIINGESGEDFSKDPQMISDAWTQYAAGQLEEGYSHERVITGISMMWYLWKDGKYMGVGEGLNAQLAALAYISKHAQEVIDSKVSPNGEWVGIESGGLVRDCGDVYLDY